MLNNPSLVSSKNQASLARMKTIADFNYPTSCTNQNSYLSHKERDSSMQNTIQVKAQQQRNSELSVIQSMLNNFQMVSNDRNGKKIDRNTTTTAFLTHEVQKGFNTSKNQLSGN